MCLAGSGERVASADSGCARTVGLTNAGAREAAERPLQARARELGGEDLFDGQAAHTCPATAAPAASGPTRGR
jgi:hypothetical protein